MNTQLIPTITSIIGSAIGIVAVSIAFTGLKTWHCELRGRTEYELARGILVGVLKVREAMNRVRNPLMSGSEWAGRPGRDPNAMFGDTEDTKYAYQRRWDAVSEAGTQLEV